MNPDDPCLQKMLATGWLGGGIEYYKWSDNSEELRKRGMNSIVASPEDQRRARAAEAARAREAQDRARVAQETADALAKAVALLRIIVPR